MFTSGEDEACGKAISYAVIKIAYRLIGPGFVCKLGSCHSPGGAPGRCERSEESHFLDVVEAKSEILRRSAPQNDMQEDFAYIVRCGVVGRRPSRNDSKL